MFCTQFENPATPAKGTPCFRNFSIGNDLFTTFFTAQMLDSGNDLRKVAKKSDPTFTCTVQRENFRLDSESISVPFFGRIFRNVAHHRL